MDDTKGANHDRFIILIQDVFLVSFLLLLVYGFASGELVSRKTLDRLINQAILDAYDQLR
jgi:hypothetical protein